MIRLTSDLWVAAYLNRLRLAGVHAHVAAKGDATAGAILVKVATMDGRAFVRHRAYGEDGDRVWAELVPPGPEPEADAAVARQRGFDPDLWVVEVEDPRGRHLLDEEGLE